MAHNDSKPKRRLLSLFSGCGGMDIGFEGGFLCDGRGQSCIGAELTRFGGKLWTRLPETSFRAVFACDILPAARECWTAYMTPRGHDPAEYRLESVVDLVRRHEAGEKVFPDGIDVVTGGFPCQDFSVAGKRRGFASRRDHRGQASGDIPADETRGRLYWWMKRVIEITRPKVFVAENVEGILSVGGAVDTIRRDFAECGYIVPPPRLLYAPDYGVPQTRRRAIFIGLRRDALRPEVRADMDAHSSASQRHLWPLPTHDTHGRYSYITCREALGHLPEPEQSDDPSQRHYSRCKYMGRHCQGQTEVPPRGQAPTIRSEHHGNIEFRRLRSEHGGQWEDELARGLPERRLTPRECALLQTFPPDYPFVRMAEGGGKRFAVSPSEAYKVIGNAVPPLLAYHIARHLDGLWGKLFTE